MLQSWLFSRGFHVVCIVLIWNDMIYIFEFVHLFSIFVYSSCDSIFVCDCLTMHPISFNLVTACLTVGGTGELICILVISNILIDTSGNRFMVIRGIHINKLTTYRWLCSCVVNEWNFNNRNIKAQRKKVSDPNQTLVDRSGHWEPANTHSLYLYQLMPWTG